MVQSLGKALHRKDENGYKDCENQKEPPKRPIRRESE
jgi:hypothetical protein